MGKGEEEEDEEQEQEGNDNEAVVGESKGRQSAMLPSAMYV